MYYLQADIAFEQLLHVALGVLHHHVDGVPVRLVLRGAHLDQLDDARVRQLPQQGNFSEHSLAVRLVLE